MTMLGLFKCTKLESWETELLLRTLEKLPHEFSEYRKQIDAGLFKGVLIGYGDIPGYVGFSFDPSAYERFENRNGRNFKVTNIKVFDSVSGHDLNYEIYFAFGVIVGYVIGSKKVKIDTKRVDTASFTKVFLDTRDYDRLTAFLSKDELRRINPADVYSVQLNGKEYFHLKDTGDGDFIGIDSQGILYEISHDPFQIKPIEGGITSL